MRTQYNSNGAARAPVGWRWLKGGMMLGLLLSLCATAPLIWAEEPGITAKAIRIGATMPLEGDYKVYGLAIKQGVDAALAGQTVQKRAIEFVVINDFYDPVKTVEAVKKLISEGIFAMVSSFGSPTTRAVLPLLAENKVPALEP